MLKLVKPQIIHKEDAINYVRECLSINGEIHGDRLLEKYVDNYELWLDMLDNPNHEENIKLGYVKDSMYFLIEENHSNIIGMINIRHVLNEYLNLYGGNIGYSIRPNKRKQGYATKMLSFALDECKSLGLNKVLITCSKENTGSRKTILNNGGILKNVVYYEKDNEYLERYFIYL